MIADKMCASLQSMAQLTYHCECNAELLVNERAALKEQGSNVSIEDLLIKAVSETLIDFPAFNSVLQRKEGTIVQSHNISIAISLDEALVAPTIFGVNAKSKEQICIDRKDLINRARKGNLTIPEMTGGSFTVSNLGLRRIHYFTPIINAPQVAILGVGRIEKKPWVNSDDKIIVAPVMGLSLTTDHRIVDGDPSGEFLSCLCDRIENG